MHFDLIWVPRLGVRTRDLPARSVMTSSRSLVWGPVSSP